MPFFSQFAERISALLREFKTSTRKQFQECRFLLRVLEHVRVRVLILALFLIKSSYLVTCILENWHNHTNFVKGRYILYDPYSSIRNQLVRH